MDIKVEGITLDIMQRALAAAGEGRRHILGEMAKCSPAPRRALSPYAPRLLQVGCAVAGGAAAHAVTRRAELHDAVLCHFGNVPILLDGWVVPGQAICFRVLTPPAAASSTPAPHS